MLKTTVKILMGTGILFAVTTISEPDLAEAGQIKLNFNRNWVNALQQVNRNKGRRPKFNVGKTNNNWAKALQQLNGKKGTQPILPRMQSNRYNRVKLAPKNNKMLDAIAKIAAAERRVKLPRSKVTPLNPKITDALRQAARDGKFKDPKTTPRIDWTKFKDPKTTPRIDWTKFKDPKTAPKALDVIRGNLKMEKFRGLRPKPAINRLAQCPSNSIKQPDGSCRLVNPERPGQGECPQGESKVAGVCLANPEGWDESVAPAPCPTLEYPNDTQRAGAYCFLGTDNNRSSGPGYCPPGSTLVTAPREGPRDLGFCLVDYEDDASSAPAEPEVSGSVQGTGTATDLMQGILEGVANAIAGGQQAGHSGYADTGYVPSQPAYVPRKSRKQNTSVRNAIIQRYATPACTRPAEGVFENGLREIKWIDQGGWHEIEQKVDLTTTAKSVSFVTIFAANCEVQGYDLVERSNQSGRDVTKTSHYDVQGQFLGYDVAVNDGTQVMTTSFLPDGSVKGVSVEKTGIVVSSATR